MRLLKTRRQKVDHVEFSATGALLAHGRDEVAYWATPTADEKPLKVSGRYVWGAAVVGESTHIAVGNSTGVHFHNLADGTAQRILGEEQRGYSTTAAGAYIVLLHAVSMPLLAHSVSPDNCGELLGRMEWPQEPAHFRSSKPCVTPDGLHFCQFEFRGWRHPGGALWLARREVATGQLFSEGVVTEFADGAVSISPDGQLLGYVHGDSVHVLKIDDRSPRVVVVFENPDQKHFTSVAFHPSGRFLAATSNDATVKLYDTSNWALATTYTWDIGRMRSVAFSPDGLLAAAGSDTGKVVVWDVDV